MSTHPSKSWKQPLHGEATAQRSGAAEAQRHVSIRLPDIRKQDVAGSLACELTESEHASLRVTLVDDDVDDQQQAVSLGSGKAPVASLTTTIFDSVAQGIAKLPRPSIGFGGLGKKRPSPLVVGMLGGCAVTMMSLGMLSFFSTNDTGPIVTKQEPMAWKVEPPVTVADSAAAGVSTAPEEAPTVVSPSAAVVAPPESGVDETHDAVPAGESIASDDGSSNAAPFDSGNSFGQQAGSLHTPAYPPRPGLARFQGYIENIPPIVEARNEPDRPGLH